MGLTAWLYEPKPRKPTFASIESFDGDLQAAIGELRSLWMEEEDNYCDILMIDDSGKVHAVLSRDETDPEICVTLHRDGKIEKHRCHYVMGRDGWYERTEITQLA